MGKGDCDWIGFRMNAKYVPNEISVRQHSCKEKMIKTMSVYVGDGINNKDWYRLQPEIIVLSQLCGLQKFKVHGHEQVIKSKGLDCIFIRFHEKYGIDEVADCPRFYLQYFGVNGHKVVSAKQQQSKKRTRRRRNGNN